MRIVLKDCGTVIAVTTDRTKFSALCEVEIQIYPTETAEVFIPKNKVTVTLNGKIKENLIKCTPGTENGLLNSP